MITAEKLTSVEEDATLRWKKKLLTKNVFSPLSLEKNLHKYNKVEKFLENDKSENRHNLSLKHLAAKPSVRAFYLVVEERCKVGK